MSAPTDSGAGEFDELDPDEGDSLVRAFTLTGGRTRNDTVQIAIERIVFQSQSSLRTAPALGPVEKEIWVAAGDRLSPAEISARLELPLGVVRVLVGDLVGAGLLDVGRTSAPDDGELVRRLIDGVRAL